MVEYGDGEGDWPEFSSNGVVVYDEGSPSPAEADHIARWDPDRALREVEAKRRRLERHHPEPRWDNKATLCAWCSAENLGVQQDWPCPDIRDDLSVYAERPGYRLEWGPR